MKITIHRGSHEIGGACLEIKTDSKIWIDLGSPLDDSTVIVPNPPDALLITHPHMDHYGLIDQIPPEVPLYAGEITQNLIQKLRPFLKKEPYPNHFQNFETWKTFSIGETSIHPYLVDHSAPEAFAFLIEYQGKRIFISGDFRNGGAKKQVFEYLCENPPKDIDILFIEGTTINRHDPKYPNEKSVEEALLPIFKNQQNISLVFGAGQNIDRIVSVYRACKRAGKKFLINPYTAYMLHLVGVKSERLPQWHWNDIFIVDPKDKYDAILRDMGENNFADQLKTKHVGNNVFQNPSHYVQYGKPNGKFAEHLYKTHHQKINLIYSMWAGYLDQEKMENVNVLKEKEYVNFYSIHTSGHAHKEDVLRLVQELKPKKVVPIHTDDPEAVKKFLENNSVTNVEVWTDGNEKEL
ncbi:MAG: MBL fold metallo-hydrolase [Brevinema sp.]